MTESSAPPTASVPELVPESFWSIVIRHRRYVAAIGLSTATFLMVGWQFAAPPPDMGSVSLLAWSAGGGGVGGGVVLGAVVLLALLLIIGLVCTVLVHPDAPHMGLFCAIAGMAMLSIRGGTAHMLIQSAQLSNTYAAVSKSLAIECLLWAILLLIAETVVRRAR